MRSRVTCEAKVENALDLALAGAMLFLVGAISRGYLWGTLNESTGSPGIELTAHVGTSTGCSEDEFDSYCELMKP